MDDFLQSRISIASYVIKTQRHHVTVIIIVD